MKQIFYIFICLSFSFPLYGITPLPYIVGYKIYMDKALTPNAIKIVDDLNEKYQIPPIGLTITENFIEVRIYDSGFTMLSPQGKIIEEQFLQSFKKRFGEHFVYERWEEVPPNPIFAIVYPLLTLLIIAIIISQWFKFRKKRTEKNLNSF